ncbi:hypothetical protein [Alicyclobacillus mengziensis]|uniref:Uncharacterized protein n=1 Tax=Alicyclobacillus mengziensis TaxID=2931921 RepID=A0A9X7W0X7_9BACL|nr:hypothetical protein [Alicyclobacillus mengziensis]QSO48427.1 hypothetical protein JZ786_05415 [Alicyclobacillus mengziensis]
MQVANAGFMVLSVLVPVLTLIFWIALIVAVFQMRNAMRNTSDKLDAVYKLLLEKNVQNERGGI